MTYQATILADSPISYWRYGESVGTTAADTADSNPGTYVASPTLGVTGALVGDANTAVTFNGTTQYTTVADATNLHIPGDVTLECWVYITDASVNSTLISKVAQPTPFAGPWVLTVLTNLKLRLLVGDGTSHTGNTSVNAIALNTWQHIVVTKQGTTVTFYVNGIINGIPQSNVHATADAGNPLYLGAQQGPSEYVRGTMDEIAIYNKALSAAQVKAHYNAGQGLFPTAEAAPSCDPVGNITEFYQYIAADGQTFNLDAGTMRSVMTSTGEGMPPIDYITQRGPFQHGETLKDFFLKPRVVQIVVRDNEQSRSLLLAARNSLISALRPNRTVGGGTPQTGVLRKWFPNGSKLDVSCLVQTGPKWEVRNLAGWDEWSYQETIQFVCFNPIYFNPDFHTQVFSTLIAQLVFPITFPITFGGMNSTSVVHYFGDWAEFPNFTINGPITSPCITNVSTGEKIQIFYRIPAGMTATITLGYGAKTITLSDGTNLMPYLTADSNLATFHLATDPEIHAGLNTITVTGTGTVAGASVTMTWYDRYISLEMI